MTFRPGRFLKGAKRVSFGTRPALPLPQLGQDPGSSSQRLDRDSAICVGHARARAAAPGQAFCFVAWRFGAEPLKHRKSRNSSFLCNKNVPDFFVLMELVLAVLRWTLVFNLRTPLSWISVLKPPTCSAEEKSDTALNASSAWKTETLRQEWNKQACCNYIGAAAVKGAQTKHYHT